MAYAIGAETGDGANESCAVGAGDQRGGASHWRFAQPAQVVLDPLSRKRALWDT